MSADRHMLDIVGVWMFTVYGVQASVYRQHWTVLSCVIVYSYRVSGCWFNLLLLHLFTLNSRYFHRQQQNNNCSRSTLINIIIIVEQKVVTYSWFHWAERIRNNLELQTLTKQERILFIYNQTQKLWLRFKVNMSSKGSNTKGKGWFHKLKYPVR